MLLYKCKLPFPVSVNSLYGGGSAQKRFPSKRYKAWLAACPALEERLISRPCHVVYVLYFPDARIRDMSNLIKCVDDYLVKSRVLEDDNWKIISRVTIAHEGIDRKNPRVEISIFPLDTKSPL